MPNNAVVAATDGGSPGSGGGLKKGPWTAAEDAILMEYVKKHGEGNWNAVQKNSGLSRCGKSCRLRWANHLRPNLKKGSFSPDEERLILELHAKLGNKWARMAAQLPGRTDNEIKNYWNTRVKRRQRAGLPLYPQDIQKQATAFHLNQYHQRRPSPSPPPPGHLSTSQQPNPNFGSSLSLLDSLNFPATTHLPGHHNSPFLPSSFHRAKRFRDNSVGFSLPFSPTSPTQTTRPSSLFSQSFNTQLPPPTSFQFSSCNFDLNPQQIMRTPFEPDGKIPSASAFSMKLELPSSQQPQPAATAAALGTSNEFKITAPVARSNSGLLDALLQEAQDKVGSVNFSREELVEEKCGFDPPSGSVFRESAATPPLASGGKWDDSSSVHSSAEVKTKKEAIDEMDSVDDELTGLLDIIPSTMSVPDWYSNSGEMSNGQSSGVTDDDIGLEMQQLASSFSVAAADQNWTVGSCSWNNMPRIC